MNKQIDRIAFEYWSGLGSSDDLEAWAEAELCKSNPHPDACELFSLSRHDAVKYSLKIAKESRGFDPVSELGETWAKELLHLYGAKLLNGEITPNVFCTLVNTYDANFMDFRKLDERTFEYPKWLGDLWSNCDWCDESWSLSNSPHLASEVKKVLRNET